MSTAPRSPDTMKEKTVATVRYQDLQRVAEEEIQHLPAGTHRMRIGKARWGQTATGKDKLVIMFVCVDGPERGAATWWNLTLNTEGFGARFFLNSLDTLGADAAFLATEPSDEALLDRIVTTREYLVTTIEREWDGQLRTDIKSVIRA